MKRDKANLAAVRRAPARRKLAKPAKAAKPAKLSPDLSPEEVAALEAQVKRHSQCERAWQRLAAPAEEEDKWSQVEEHLLAESDRPDAERGWKYFAK